jgi:hypothetical protein
MSAAIQTYHTVSIQPVLGGFVVHYPVVDDKGDVDHVQEVATSLGKAMRIAKAAVEKFSLVKKTADDDKAE